MYVGGVLRSEVDLSTMRPYGLGAPKAKPVEGKDNCNWCQGGALEMDKVYVVCRVDEWDMVSQ